MTEPALNFNFPTKILNTYKSDKHFNVLRGGRGGGKSWGIADILIAKTYQTDKLVLCTREIQNTIKDSVLKLLSDRMTFHGLADSYYTIQKNEIYGKHGSKFIFKGLRHNSTEIKSTEGIDYCWLEEGHKTSRESLDILIPTVRNEGSQFYIGYNPDDENDPIHQDFVVNSMPDSFVQEINYYDNPFFPNVLRKLMDWDRVNDTDKYNHIWKGQVKKISDACIFKGKFIIDTFETHDDVDFYYGSDWGFSVDPTTLVRCYIKDECLYIDYEAYGVGVELDEIPQLFDSVPGSRENIITADSARPDTISHVRNKGFHIKSARKGKNSIEDGIEFLRSFKKVIIHTRCKNTKYEFENYSYKKDRTTDEILPIIVDKNNHIMDSLRYATEKLRKSINQAQGKPKVKRKNVLGW